MSKESAAGFSALYLLAKAVGMGAGKVTIARNLFTVAETVGWLVGDNNEDRTGDKGKRKDGGKTEARKRNNGRKRRDNIFLNRSSL